jgi:hypothetical protein
MAPLTGLAKKVEKIADEVEAVKMGSGHGVAGPSINRAHSESEIEPVYSCLIDPRFEFTCPGALKTMGPIQQIATPSLSSL